MGDKCEIRWCKSGEPATVRVTENIGDGAFRVDICHQCAKVLDLVDIPIVLRRCSMAGGRIKIDLTALDMMCRVGCGNQACEHNAVKNTVADFWCNMKEISLNDQGICEHQSCQNPGFMMSTWQLQLVADLLYNALWGYADATINDDNLLTADAEHFGFKFNGHIIMQMQTMLKELIEKGYKPDEDTITSARS